MKRLLKKKTCKRKWMKLSWLVKECIQLTTSKSNTTKKLMPVVLWTAVWKQIEKRFILSLFLVSSFTSFSYAVRKFCPKGEKGFEESLDWASTYIWRTIFLSFIHMAKFNCGSSPPKKVIELNSWRYIPWYQVAVRTEYISIWYIKLKIEIDKSHPSIMYIEPRTIDNTY